ncbi:hypothetical protein GCM10020000_84860 [Streptomyces olivoverticillatus]
MLSHRGEKEAHRCHQGNRNAHKRPRSPPESSRHPPNRPPADTVRALFGSHRLSPAQRRIAQYITDHPTEAAFLSITDLAERVGVSQPSVTRFATSLGFTGYPALREALQPLALSAATSPP